MIFDPFPLFLPSEYRVKFATESWEAREAAALRRQVFCTEQGIFAGDDRDAIDDVAISIVAIGSYRDGHIEAEKLLVKCPSKYQGAEVEKSYSSTSRPAKS